MRSKVEAVELINRSGIIREFVTHKGKECSSCGLPRKAAGRLMEVPGLVGQYCSVLCAEQAIYEKGCHWCGEKLETGRFCSDACQEKAKGTQLGSGKRLREWLIRRGILSAPAAAVHGETCLYCGGEMEGKRADASFCSERCRSAYRRESGKLENGQIVRSSPQQNHQLNL
jgi:predicted nucleic acid-binding Zn ribbon protein